MKLKVTFKENDVAFRSTFNGVQTIHGKDGKDGKSAYQIALDNGFVGTEEEWLDSLHGKDGQDGKDGIDGHDGFSPAVTVHSITGGHQVSITDKNGTQAFEVMNGSDVLVFDDTVEGASMTFEEALATIEAGRSLVAYDVISKRAYTLQYWGSNYIVFWSKTQHEIAETGIWEKATYHKDNTWETEYLALDAFSFGTVTPNEDGILSCDKSFMDLIYDDLGLGKVIGLKKQSAAKTTIYYYSGAISNESTGGIMAVFASPTGEFLGLGFDNSVIELTDYSVHVDWNNIQNRPFGDAITLVDNRTFSSLLDNGAIVITPALKLEEGKKYTVIYNGAEYKTTAIAFNDIPEFGSGVGIGNGAAFGFPDTGEPFIIGYNPDYGDSLIIPLDGSTEVTFTVIRDLEVMDEKYLPMDDIIEAVKEALPTWEGGEY